MRLLFVFLIVGCFVLYSSTAFALVVETQPMSFGLFALTNNNAQYDYIVKPDGTRTVDPEFLVISDGLEASYDVSAFPTQTFLIITVIANSITLNGGGTGNSFSLLTFTTFPASPKTDNAGNETFKLGATLRTSGNSSMYVDGNYSGTMDVTVNF